MCGLFTINGQENKEKILINNHRYVIIVIWTRDI